MSSNWGIRIVSKNTGEVREMSALNFEVAKEIIDLDIEAYNNLKKVIDDLGEFETIVEAHDPEIQYELEAYRDSEFKKAVG